MKVRRVLGVVLAAVLLAGAACGDDSGGSSSSGGGGGQTEAPIDTPARTQLEWVLASGPTADDAQMAEHFAPAFLMQVPAAEMRAVLAGLIGATVREVTDSSDTKLKAQVSTGSGIPLLAEIAVEDEEPHRIIGSSSLHLISLTRRPAGRRSTSGWVTSGLKAPCSPPRWTTTASSG